MLNNCTVSIAYLFLYDDTYPAAIIVTLDGRVRVENYPPRQHLFAYERLCDTKQSISYF